MHAHDLSLTRHCHCLAARRQARVLTRLYEQKLRPHGVRATWFSILAALALKGPTPVTGGSPQTRGGVPGLEGGPGPPGRTPCRLT